MTSRRQTYRWTSEDITLCSSLGGSRVVAREPIGANTTDVDAFDRSGTAFCSRETAPFVRWKRDGRVVNNIKCERSRCH